MPEPGLVSDALEMLRKYLLNGDAAVSISEVICDLQIVKFHTSLSLILPSLNSAIFDTANYPILEIPSFPLCD